MLPSDLRTTTPGPHAEAALQDPACADHEPVRRVDRDSWNHQHSPQTHARPGGENQSARDAPAGYGYWIDSGGRILAVDRKAGHVPVLMDARVFARLSPLHRYHVWYEAALSQGWVRVVAPVEPRQRFSFQFKALLPAPRRSLVTLLNDLPPYNEYVFEAPVYQIFPSSREAVGFLEQCSGPVSGLTTASWTSDRECPVPRR